MMKRKGILAAKGLKARLITNLAAGSEMAVDYLPALNAAQRYRRESLYDDALMPSVKTMGAALAAYWPVGAVRNQRWSAMQFENNSRQKRPKTT